MSRHFNFRLQPVLKLRQKDEDRAKEQLATTISLRAQGREMLASADSLVAQAKQAERDAGQQPITADQLAAQQLWRERLERHRLAAGQQLEEADGEVAISRRALVHAHQRRAALDRLKDIKLAAHRDDAQRAEAAEADEIGLRQHHARGRAA